MTFQTKPAATLPMIESHLSFAILKAAFDPPAAERHAQQFLHRRARRSVAQEVFDLARERVVTHEQVMMRLLRQPPFVFDMDEHVLDVPDQRPFLGVLDPPRLPRLSGQRRVRLSQMLDRLGLGAASHQAWDFPPTAPLSAPQSRPLASVWGVAAPASMRMDADAGIISIALTMALFTAAVKLMSMRPFETIRFVSLISCRFAPPAWA